MDFPKLLTNWYLQNKRDLPWRATDEPYLIWLSEIILQQTRVSQGMPYFFAFSEAFPTVFDLAAADEEKVLKLWQGLGYYSRARNLHKTAQFIAFELNGNFPDNYDALLKLKGVGAYTAAAIASFSYNEPVPVVDGNVFRVLSRVFGVETDIASGSARKEFTALAKALMPDDRPALFNQAMMEFGALQCVPKSPDCPVCPMNSGCAALQQNIVAELPVKAKKNASRNRYFNYFVFSDENGQTILRKRTGKGIWHNLYEFPLVETEAASDLPGLPIIDSPNEIVSVEDFRGSYVVHKLSHQNLHITFRKVNVSGRIEGAVSPDRIHDFPMPIVLFNFIEKHWN
jgi:A/G-specific adenine glycosylase